MQKLVWEKKVVLCSCVYKPNDFWKINIFIFQSIKMKTVTPIDQL